MSGTEGKVKNIQVIDKSEIKTCWACDGKRGTNCKTCNGTGIWREPNYIIVAEQSKGQRIAFQVDFIK